MKGPLLTHVEKSSSDPRWEESTNLQLQADPSFPTHPSYTSPQGRVQCLKPDCGFSAHDQQPSMDTKALCQQPCGRAPPSRSSVQSAQLPASWYPPGKGASSFHRNKAQPCYPGHTPRGETVAVPGEWDHPVMEATHWGTPKLTPQWGPLLARSNLLSQPLPGNQRT